MGAHHPRHVVSDGRGLQRLAVLVVTPIAVLTLVGLIAMWPSAGIELPEHTAPAGSPAVILSIDRQSCTTPPTADVNGCGTAELRFDSDESSSGGVIVPLPNGPGAPKVQVGDAVLVLATETPDGQTFAIVDHQRRTQMWILGAAFTLALIAFGRWRGLMALVGLGITFALLVLFVVPAILAGQDPLLVAIVGSAAIMLTVLYLTHGFNAVTTVAVLGTVASLALTGVLSAVAIRAMHLTGVADEISATVGLTHSVNMEGLLLAAIVIGSLGVLDDVTVTQAATVTEVAQANPGYRFIQLYRAGSRVGRAHIASVVNTIVLAYAGSSLPLLVLIAANNDSLAKVLTTQVIAQEIVRSAIATLGLVAAVPLTTALAALSSERSRYEDAA